MTRMEYIRRCSGIKQQDLARQIGMSASRLNAIERGYARLEGIGGRVRIALEKHFGMGIEELLSPTE